MKTTILALAATAGTVSAQQGAYQQCGGTGFSGSTSCISGYTCHVYSQYYAQCIPSGSASSAAVSTTTSVAKPSSTSTLTTISSKSTTASSTQTSTSSSASPTTSGTTGKVSYAGVNIAGFDFGCTTDGSCNLADTQPPGQTGLGQMDHFVTDDGLNAFRLPVAWQYLVNNDLGGTLDSSNFATYNSLVQGCLNSGAKFCLVDIHNYARWNGAIIGQGGPTNQQFASLWSQLAAQYKSQPRVAFGIMNEPHDLTIGTWAQSVQAAVTAIRQAGATENICLLPGTDYTSAANFLENGSGAALLNVTNLDGSTTNLIFDVHKYLDSDNSGTHAECVTNNSAAFETLGSWLRTNRRQAILSETGGGPTATSCFTYLCQELATLNQYSDVYLGWLGWAAGSFLTTYTLSETPTENNGVWTDQPLVTQCIVGEFTG